MRSVDEGLADLAESTDILSDEGVYGDQPTALSHWSPYHVCNCKTMFSRRESFSCSLMPSKPLESVALLFLNVGFQSEYFPRRLEQ
jgi:hypothetical protein